MYLKTIEVQGFKSFANRIVFRFHNGITGIVGPNGSGKSNVADAVRWVLGEQSAKSLRGGSMQDVIFAGTQLRKPLGYASVAITLDNTDHSLPISYDEVTVTRRLYRSGESEYLLNGTACRLRDINELFYDTGIGKEGYSIIGQGQIEKILSGKPEDRRELFDEAAGIVKFKRRKKEAQKKLENEQQNLLRVSDILSELTRQIGPLERQSEKAKIYLKWRDELKAYDINLFLTEIDEIKATLEQAQNSLAQAREEQTDVDQKSDAIRAQYEVLSAQQADLEQAASQLLEALTQKRLLMQQQQGRIDLIAEQTRLEAKTQEARRQRLAEIEETIAQKEADCDAISEGIADLENAASDLKSATSLQETQLRVLTGRLDQTTQRLDDNKAALVKLLEDRSGLQAQKERCETLLEQIRIRRAQLDAQVLRLRSEEKDQKKAAGELEAQLAEAQQAIASLAKESDTVNTRLSSLQEELNAWNAQAEQDQSAYHREASRLETLKNIAERYDGYGGAIRIVMEQKSREKGLLGVVADLIRTEQSYETAIETALGGSIQNIVTEDEGTAKRMISFLKQGRYGRATFLPLTAMKDGRDFSEPKALSEEGAIGLANTLVRTDQKFGALVRSLLGRTLVVDTLDHATMIARKYRYSLRIVTLDGELLSPGGSMTGGAFKNSSNLLGRRREIEDLEKKVASLRRALEKRRHQIDAARDERTGLREQLVSISEKLQEQYLKQNTAQVSLKELTGKTELTANDVRAILQEHSGQEQQEDEVKAQLTEAEAALSGSDEAQQKLEAAGDALRKEQERLQKKREEETASLEQSHLEIASGEQKAAYLQQELKRISQEIAALTQEKKELGEKQRAHSGSEEERSDETAALQAQIASLTQEIAKGEDEHAALIARKDACAQKQSSFFEEREALTQRSALLEKECIRLQSQMERQEEKRDARSAYMWEEYELTYGSAQALRRDDLGSKTEWRRQMNTLKAQIKELGSVNVNAIEEYKEVSERHTFLSAQHEDLIKAQKALEKIIAELDEGMRTRFKEQFGRIQEEFNKAFQELFGGGIGTLELMEEDDILEAGIRIIAQPPGKKLQNMMQLSGGEKSLTAIALLFAIQNLKPSPFCLLDEIEAALDENNVDRYARYLHKLTKHTQFIIITHRRGTMAAADRLYGITMQEKGVSTLVSVDLIESELDA